MKTKLNRALILLLSVLAILCFAVACTAPDGGDDNAHVHDYKIVKYDESKHWFECECGEKTNETSHTIVNNVCVCGYEKVDDSGENLDENVGGEAHYTRYGDYIEFGSYPQTIKASDVTVSETANSNGYYMGSDGAEYAKVVANPYENNYKFSDESEVVSGTTYYFKVEPIRWRILSEENGIALILCDGIIGSKAYQSSYYYSYGDYYTTANGAPSGTTVNNYKYSEIRAWLNDEFLNTAFDNDERTLIKTTVVDNGAESAGYTEDDFTYEYSCENTNDKVFLLSYKEAISEDYGMNYDMETSDYARATGAFMSTDSDYYGLGGWWLRSPGCDRDYLAMCFEGDDAGGVGVGVSPVGVVPALQIQLG